MAFDTMESAREAVATAVEAAKAGAPVADLVIEYDNRTLVDTATATKPFLRVELVFGPGYQADISATPLHRFTGNIVLSAAVKEGQGSAEALKLLAHFYLALQSKQFGAVRTKKCSPGGSQPFKGWVYHRVFVPFWFDTVD